ncbi:Pentatricopeptide repeat-containing protein At1g64580 [Linum perenne]
MEWGQQYGCYRNVTTCNKLLDGLHKSEQTKDGLELYKDMEEKGIIKPKLITYNSILHSVCRAGMIDMVLQLIEKMIVSRVKPDAITYNTTTDAYSRKGKIMDSGMNTNVATWNVLVREFFNSLGHLGSISFIDDIIFDK